MTPDSVLCEVHTIDVFANPNQTNDESWLPIRLKRPEGVNPSDSSGKSRD